MPAQVNLRRLPRRRLKFGALASRKSVIFHLPCGLEVSAYACGAPRFAWHSASALGGGRALCKNTYISAYPSALNRPRLLAYARRRVRPGKVDDRRLAPVLLSIGLVTYAGRIPKGASRQGEQELERASAKRCVCATPRVR